MIKGPLKILLFPFSLLFGLLVRIRNWLYDNDILKSESFDIPLISVGNLAVGGTGKTPHIEYLIETLCKDFKLAVLSRGYKRKTSGFLLADDSHRASDIGDEPAQIKNKYPEIVVAVDADRREGIRKIMEQFPETDLILLDDAFQHRKVNPGINILISDFSNRFTGDYLMPYGRLREHRKNSRRADFIIVSRSPLDLSPINRRLIVREMPLLSHQYLYFTSVIYREPEPLFSETPEPLCLNKIAETRREILLVSGIASPGYLKDYLAVYSTKIIHLDYPDHHKYNNDDLEDIIREYKKLSDGNRCIITTEKDAARLKEIVNIADFPDMGIYFIPIAVSFLNNDAEEFNKFIKEYVRKNKSNSKFS